MKNWRLALVVCCAILTAVEGTMADTDWAKMKGITPRGYVCYRAAGPIRIDGKADEPSWADAPWTEDFVDIEGSAKPVPRFRTRAKMLWDDQYFYVYAELQEPHVWGTLTKKNSVMFLDNDFEVFINPDASNHNYYEFETNALSTIWELTLDRPYRDDGPVHLGTNMEGLKSAVHVDGTLNDPSDTDRGWSVEIAIPWKGLARYATQTQCPPKDGQQWRMAFSRVEWLVDIIDGKYRKIAGKPEDNWVWTPQGVVDLHRPERWGYVQFSIAAPGAAQFHPDPMLPARDKLMEIYYAQKAFLKEHGHYAASLGELGVSDPSIEMATTGAQFTASTRAGDRVVHVRQDSKLWVDSETKAPATAPAASAADLPPAGLGQADPKISKIVSEISQERIGQTMKTLGDFETRNTLSDPSQPHRGVGAARQWIFDQFKSYSPRLQVSFDSHQIPKGGRVWKPVELRNVVAILPGTGDKQRWILISGHYDTVNLRIPPEMAGHPERAAELPAPGVSDDASGVACAMECARVMSQYEFDATLVFVAFAGEEQGLVGSRAMAQRLKSSGQEIEAVLNNDIIGTEVAGNGRSDPRRVLLFSEDPDDSPSRELARFVHLMGGRYFPEMRVEMIFRRDRFGRAGDHTPFNEAGYPGVRLTTPNENFANQHSPTDTFENASPAYATRVVRINAAAAAALALAPPPPITHAPAVELRHRPGLSRGAGYDAVLRWSWPKDAAEPAGFVAVMRSTVAPDWEREFWAGNVREYTLKDTAIDQLVFGVKAVDSDGHESPVSAYLLPPPLRGATSD